MTKEKEKSRNPFKGFLKGFIHGREKEKSRNPFKGFLKGFIHGREKETQKDESKKVDKPDDQVAGHTEHETVDKTEGKRVESKEHQTHATRPETALPEPGSSRTATLWDAAASSLEPEDKKKIDAIKQGGVSADQVVLVIERAKKLKDTHPDSTWRCILDNIVKCSIAANKVGDTVAKYDASGYASLGWSVVSFGLQVAGNAKEAGEFILKSSDDLADYLARYAEYEYSFRGEHAGHDFDRLITDVYKAVLLCVLELHKYLQQCGPERLLRAVSPLPQRSITDRIKAIDEADAKVKDWLVPIIYRTFTDRLPMPTSPAKTCLHSLSFPEMEDRFLNIEDAVDGTCKWLLRHQTYQDWILSDRGLLWIKGKPGSGKSTLLRYALGEAMLSFASSIEGPTVVLWFFFHGRGSELQKSPLGFFRAILHQLLRALPEAVQEMVSYFEEKNRDMGGPGIGWQWNVHQLQRFLKSSLPRVLQTHSVLLYIDALDECGEDNAVKLIDQLKTLLKELPAAASQIRFCFTCRHYPILSLDYGFEVCSEHENQDDIAKYVQAQLAAPEIPDSLRQMITERASGVFMWARLVTKKVLDYQRGGLGWKAIEESIGIIPEDLQNLYLDLVKGMKNGADRADSLRLMQWICFAKRPLTLEDLRWAMVVDANCQYPSLEACQESPRYIASDPSLERRLQTLSCGLVEIKRRRRFEMASKIFVEFIHQSVRDFFVEDGLSALNNMNHPEASAGAAHYELSRACIHFIAMDEPGTRNFWDLLWGRSKGQSLVAYAVEFWGSHARESEEKNVPQNDLLAMFDLSSDHLLQRWAVWVDGIWPHVRTSDQGLVKRAPRARDKTVHVMSYFGLEGPMRAIIEKRHEANIEIDIRNGLGQSPLSIAAERGHQHIVQLLLDSGIVKIHSEDNKSWTPILYAIKSRKINIVQALLSTGKVEINSKDDTGRSPLSHAAEAGAMDIIQLLFNMTKPQVDSEDKHGRTPLSYAAQRGHEAVVQLLLGTDVVRVNSEDNKDRTPLSYAAEQGREAVVQLLLGIDVVGVNSEGNKGRTPLSYAAERGHEAVVQLLLGTEGVRVDSEDNKGRTPLSYAAEEGHEAVVQLLLRTDGVQVNSEDNKGRTPLSYAAGNNHEALVRLLLGREGVRVDLKDKKGRTPLSHAARSASQTVVQLLLGTDGVRADSEDNKGRTPLSFAAERADSGDDKGRTPSSYLSAYLSPYLSHAAERADSEDNKDRTPLSYATELAGPEAVVQLLLGTDGVRADSKDNKGRTPLSYAAERGGPEAVVQLLLGRDDVRADSKDNKGRTPLSWAAEGGNPEALRQLLPRTDDVQVNLEDNKGRTPLSYAAAHWNSSALRLLLRTGQVKVNKRDCDGMDPFFYAAAGAQLTNLWLLLETGDVDFVSEDGRRALSLAMDLYPGVSAEIGEEPVDGRSGCWSENVNRAEPDDRKAVWQLLRSCQAKQHQALEASKDEGLS